MIRIVGVAPEIAFDAAKTVTLHSWVTNYLIASRTIFSSRSNGDMTGFIDGRKNPEITKANG
ncbi:hypothetical protein [Acidithrix sp. C25]|uniref:hypothetical protein n=1 Tax=Acidithrix sp. C25 TaxID=1671482 RepID=UPI001BD0A6CC|nr:hypothetical protein [Acidithrix sp. C25]